MAEVRSGIIAPVLEDFRSSDGTPLYVNRMTSRGYVLNNADQIVPLSGQVLYANDYPTLTAAYTAAIAANIRTIIFAEGIYHATAGVTLTNLVHFVGLAGSMISKEFDGDLFTSQTSHLKWINVNVNANGNTYTGAVIRFKTNSTHEEWAGGRIEEGADSIFLFEDLGGVRCNIHDVESIGLSSANLATGAIVKRTVSAVDTQAGPRHFHHICTEAFTWFANVNGFHGAYFDHVYSAGITVGDNSLGCTVNNCRLAVPTGMTAHISGNSTIMTMCEIGGDLTVDAGFFYGQFVNNTMDPTKTFTDNSIKLGAPSMARVEDPRLAIGLQLAVIATANLPAASSSMDGRLIGENAGFGVQNIILYANGQRFRIPGGAAF